MLTQLVWGDNLLQHKWSKGTIHGGGGLLLAWEAVDDGSQPIRQLDGEYGLVYAVTRNGEVYSRLVDGSGSWRKIPGPAGEEMVYVTASGRDIITGITAGGNIYRCMKPCVGEWEKMEGSARQCDADIIEVHYINSTTELGLYPVILNNY